MALGELQFAPQNLRNRTALNVKNQKNQTLKIWPKPAKKMKEGESAVQWFLS
jgi:hypothetical protein